MKFFSVLPLYSSLRCLHQILFHSLVLILIIFLISHLNMRRTKLFDNDRNNYALLIFFSFSDSTRKDYNPAFDTCILRLMLSIDSLERGVQRWMLVVDGKRQSKRHTHIKREEKKSIVVAVLYWSQSEMHVNHSVIIGLERVQSASMCSEYLERIKRYGKTSYQGGGAPEIGLNRPHRNYKKGGVHLTFLFTHYFYFLSLRQYRANKKKRTRHIENTRNVKSKGKKKAALSPVIISLSSFPCFSSLACVRRSSFVLDDLTVDGWQVGWRLGIFLNCRSSNHSVPLPFSVFPYAAIYLRGWNELWQRVVVFICFCSTRLSRIDWRGKMDMWNQKVKRIPPQKATSTFIYLTRKVGLMGGNVSCSLGVNCTGKFPFVCLITVFFSSCLEKETWSKKKQERRRNNGKRKEKWWENKLTKERKGERDGGEKW